jgi:hypothetical protein
LRGYPDVVGPLTAGTLIVNIRAESAPGVHPPHRKPVAVIGVKIAP